jgi:hypothetical protein
LPVRAAKYLGRPPQQPLPAVQFCLKYG